MAQSWRGSGSGFPVVDFSVEIPPEAVLELLVEDLYQLVSPDGRYILDVGFYPEMDPEGGFGCKLIQDDDWENPVKEKHFRSTEDVLNWLVEESDKVNKTIYKG